MVIVFVFFKVSGQIRNPPGQHGHLHLGTTRIPFVNRVFFHDALFCHRIERHLFHRAQSRPGEAGPMDGHASQGARLATVTAKSNHSGRVPANTGGVILRC